VVKSIIILLSVFVFSLFLGCTSEPVIGKVKKLDIVLKSDKTVMVENSSYTLAGLDSLLRNYESQTVVTLKPDKDVEMGFIQDIRAKLKSANIDQVIYDGNFD
jgi:biopolymer transport protein ExbD